MLRGVGFHLLRAVAVVFGVVSLTFVLLHLAPGDPAAHLLGPAATPAQLAAARHTLGLDRALPVQYVTWVSRAIHGDFGISIARGRPVASLLAEAWPATALLVVLSLGASYLLGIAIGAWQANTRSRVLDGGLSVTTVALAAMPGYWLALVLVMVFTYRFELLPSFGARGLDADFLAPWPQLLDRLRHIALPLLTLTLIGMGGTARYVRASLRDLRDAPFMVVARAKGLSARQVIARHQLRNGLIPVITLLGLSLPALFSGTVFVEAIFAWPGVGQVLVQAVQARDYPVVMAAATVSAMLVVLGNLLAEVLVGLVDPRTRSSDVAR
jgi:peptide/nickel transport system permease protein